MLHPFSYWSDIAMTSLEKIKELVQFNTVSRDSNLPLIDHIAASLGTQPTEKHAPYGAEAGQFQAAGFPTVVCGPGSIDQAHKPNEFIALDQIDQGEHLLRKLIARLSNP